jgi:hypothetical protein
MKTIEKECVDCKKMFTARSNAALRCAKCKVENRRKIEKKCREKYGQKQYVKSAKKRYMTELKKMKEKRLKENPNFKSVSEIVKEIEEYNRKNGKRLTYGEYIALTN